MSALALAAAAITGGTPTPDRDLPIAARLPGPMPSMFRGFRVTDGPLAVRVRRGEPFLEPGCARHEAALTRLCGRIRPKTGNRPGSVR